MSDHIEKMAVVRDAFTTLEAALKELSPIAKDNLTKAQLAKFRQARRGISAAHCLLAEIAEEINQGPEGEVVTLGGGT
jgi:hypothetical protein